jgi:hypothetical protein
MPTGGTPSSATAVSSAADPTARVPPPGLTGPIPFAMSENCIRKGKPKPTAISNIDEQDKQDNRKSP